MFVAPKTGSASGARRRVLAITSQPPWPLDSGGHIRTFHLMRALAGRFDLRLVTPVEQRDAPVLAPLAAHGLTVHAAVTGPRHALGEGLSALRAFASGTPYVMYRRHDRPAVRDAIRQELAAATPDAIYLDHIDPYAYRFLFPAAQLVIDFHNLYARLASRVAEEAGGLAGWYLRREASRLERVERRAVADAAAVLAVSAEEQRAFEAHARGRVTLVPNGVDCARYRALPAGRPVHPPVLLFLGALSWPPNAAAAEFLAAHVLPPVRRTHPEARLWIVGRQPGPAVRALGGQPGVEVHADVPDVMPFLTGASLMAVPLVSGGGTRLKILEAFAAGLPVVSTRVGCEGLEATHGEHVWVAERDGFAHGVIDVLGDASGAAGRAARARALVEDRYDWTAIGARACDAVAGTMRTP